MDDIKKKHIAQVVKVISDILGGQTMVLQRIERAFSEQNKANKELLNQAKLLDNKIHGGFTVLENTRIASMEKNISKGLQNLDYSYLRKLKQELDSLHIKLQQQVNAQFLQLLIKRSKQPRGGPRVRLPGAARPTVTPTFVRPSTAATHAIAAAIPQAQGPITQPEAATEAVDGDWTESELEGGQIFDTIITGWKRRDWETIVKGTKEMFMRGWKKLSKSDKQKIRNGAWSKPIIKKLMMIARDL